MVIGSLTWSLRIGTLVVTATLTGSTGSGRKLMGVWKHRGDKWCHFFFFCSTALGGASHHGATQKVQDWKTEPPSGLLYQRRLPTDRAISTLPTHQQFITVGEKRDGKRKDSVRRNLQHVRVLLFCLRKNVRTFKKNKTLWIYLS